jgi:predicted nucleic acid-binding protein
VLTYVDTSTLIKLIVDEEGSDRADLIWESADALASVALIEVEARATLAAAHRGGRLTTSQLRATRKNLGLLLSEVHLVDAIGPLVAQAADLAEAESLRGYDAVHLAAALSVQADVLTSADSALCDAAGRRGLHVANPLAP